MKHIAIIFLSLVIFNSCNKDLATEEDLGLSTDKTVIKYKPETFIFEHKKYAHMVRCIDSTCIIVDMNFPNIEKIKEGTIIASDFRSRSLYDLFVYKIKNVETQGDEIILKTRECPLFEAFEDLLVELKFAEVGPRSNEKLSFRWPDGYPDDLFKVEIPYLAPLKFSGGSYFEGGFTYFVAIDTTIPNEKYDVYGLRNLYGLIDETKEVEATAFQKEIKNLTHDIPLAVVAGATASLNVLEKLEIAVSGKGKLNNVQSFNFNGFYFKVNSFGTKTDIFSIETDGKYYVRNVNIPKENKFDISGELSFSIKTVTAVKIAFELERIKLKNAFVGFKLELSPKLEYKLFNTSGCACSSELSTELSFIGRIGEILKYEAPIVNFKDQIPICPNSCKDLNICTYPVELESSVEVNGSGTLSNQNIKISVKTISELLQPTGPKYELTINDKTIGSDFRTNIEYFHEIPYNDNIFIEITYDSCSISKYISHRNFIYNDDCFINVDQKVTYDNTVFNQVQIGNQIWLKENANRFGIYATSDPNEDRILIEYKDISNENSCPFGYRIPKVEDFEELISGNPKIIGFCSNPSGRLVPKKGESFHDAKLIDEDKAFYWTNSPASPFNDEFYIMEVDRNGYAKIGTCVKNAYLSCRCIKDQ